MRTAAAPTFSRLVATTRKIFFSVLLFLAADITVSGQLQLVTPSDAGLTLGSNSTFTVRWRRGGTTFNRVRIKLSADGGLTYPYLLVNNTPSTASDTSENITIPGIITSTARIRVTNQADSTVGDASDNNFAITGYCWPWSMSCTNVFINTFRLNAINSTSTCSARAYVVYNPAAPRTTNLYTGQSFSFTIKTSKTFINNGVGIWCDFNNDQDFDDAGEFLYGSPSLDTTFNGTIAIPPTASAGNRRLRIRAVRGNLPGAGNACTFYNTGGEMEDYTVSISSLQGTGPLVVRQPNAAGINLDNNTTYTVRWSKGSTAYDQVRIKLSTDGGATFPHTLISSTPSTPTDTAENILVPGLISSQARIRVTNVNDSTEGDASDNNFTIRGYCWPWSMSCTNNFISRFTINTLNSSSTCSPRAYVNYGSTRTTGLYTNETYPFRIVTSKVNLDYGAGIWIDYNRDQDFDDAGEFVFGSSTLDTAFTGNIAIPAGLTLGNYRMRVRIVRANLLTAGNACTFYNTGGEIEDYQVTIDQVVSAGPLVVRNPSAAGITLTSAATSTARWSKGGTTFSKVRIKFSEDGGLTFPYLLVNNTDNTTADTTEPFTVPGIITTEGRIQITNQADSTTGDISDNNFSITGYCWPWNTSCSNMSISRVAINSLAASSGCGSRGYSVISPTGSNTTSLFAGQSYQMTVKTTKTNRTNGVAVWCDFNNDQSFDDADELLFTSGTLDTTFNFPVTIPEGVSIGPRRLRVRAVRNSLLGAGDFCTFFNTGSEIEDYTISIDSARGSGPLTVLFPSASGISVASASTQTARWSRGATTFDRVRIKLSVDGGSTYPYLLANNTPSTATDTSESFTVPGIPTSTARIRITNQSDSTVGDFSDENFSITGYCWPWGMTCTNNFISRFTFNTLNRTSTCGNSIAYAAITASGTSTTIVYPGETYDFSVRTSKTNPTQGAGIWADWNNDQDFDDAGEFLFGSSTLDTTFTGEITVPPGTTPGQKRLRVRNARNQLMGAGDFCTIYTSGGETEDYTITVDQILGTGPLEVLAPNAAGTSLGSNTSFTVRWKKGGTTYGRVRIKLSTDGGSTFPYLLVNNTNNTATDSSEAIVVPGLITSTARIRVSNQADSTIGDNSDNNFAITGYCWPWASNCSGNSINSVTINTLTSTSTCGNARGYSEFATTGGRTTTMQRGLSYPFTISTSTNSTSMAIGIWCDLNQDFDFSDPGEFLYGSPSFGTTFTGNITIPASSSTGQKRLRIRTLRGRLLTASDACAFYNIGGEIEDYTITINQPTITITNTPTEICPGIPLSVAFTTTGTFLSGNTFQVQISNSSGVFGAGTSVIGSGASSPVSCFVGLGTPGGTYRLRVVSSTPVPAVFGTNSATFTIRNKPAQPVATPASVSRCGAGTASLSVTGCTTTEWYDAQNQGNLVGTGASFTTPVLTNSRTYYAACVDGQGCRSSRTSVRVQVSPVPSVTSLSSNSGRVGFDNVTITGSSLTILDSVRFSGGVRARVLSGNNTSITVEVPVGAGTGPVTVFTRCGSASSPQIFSPVVPTIAQPTFGTPGGNYATSVTTTLSCATEGAEIYYTLNGMTPDPAHPLTLKYTGTPIFVGSGFTLKAIGFRTGWVASAVAQAVYTVDAPTIVAQPVITPVSGSYTGGQVMSITCSTPQTTIWFTLNGQIPRPGVNTPIRYLGPITLIDPQVTIRALATREGWADSPVALETITITGGSALTPCTFSPVPGSYPTAQTVTISNSDPLAQIFFTTDGTEPYRYFPLARPYAGPVAINATRTLKAQAYRDGFEDSPRTVGIYVIGPGRMAVDGNNGEPDYYAEAVGPANTRPEEEKRWSLRGGNRLEVGVRPNPGTGIFFLDYNSQREDVAIEVFNPVGQVVNRIQTEGAAFGSVLSLEGNPAGMYLLRIRDKEGNSIDKKVVLR